MKKLYKYLSAAAFSGILCMSLIPSANAQHNRNNGGGGGGGGGGNAAASRPAPAPTNGGGYSGHVNVSPSRPASAPSRPAVSSTNNNPRQQGVRPVGVNRQNGAGQHSVGVVQRYSGHNIGVGVAPRNGVTAQRYRTYQGSVYGRNHPGSAYYGRGYLPGRASYHYNRGYYGSYYAPRLGFSIGFLPYGYYPFYFGDYQYYYSDGLFYQYNNDQYTVVEPPVGAEVTTLPKDAQSIVINGQQYYEVNGVYYEPITKDDGTLSYQVAGKDGELNTNDGSDQSVDNNAPPAPQIGDIITELPPNCRKININGEKLYLSPDGVYFKAQLDQDNNKVYKIVGLPADEDQNQPDQGGN